MGSRVFPHLKEKPTEALAHFITRLKFEDIPQNCLSVIKMAFLDALGCGLFGSTTPWSKIINEMVKDCGGNEEATLWANGYRGPCHTIVMGLGSMIHSFELDDYHNAKVHPGAVVQPAAVTYGEKEGISGRELITALLAGYETMIRISLGTGPSASRKKGWHLTGTCGPFGAAAAVGKILGLDHHQMLSALGLAGTQSAGLWAFIADGSMSKRFHPGKAAHSGIIAVELAKKGFLGPSQILEAEDGGFCRATSDEFNLARITEGLGEIYETSLLCIKFYPACGSVQSSIDAALKLKNENKIPPEDIKEIVVKSSSAVILQCGWDYEPLSILQAQMSLKYAVATAVFDGEVSVDQFSEERIRDPEILQFIKKIKVILDEEIDQAYPEKFSSKVEIYLKDGSIVSAYVEHPKGSPGNPVTAKDVENKFLNLSSRVVGREKALRIIEIVGQLEELDDLRRLTRLLV